jgi:hypothetical protein
VAVSSLVYPAQVCSWEGRGVSPSAAGPHAGSPKISVDMCHDAAWARAMDRWGGADRPLEGTLLMRAVLVREFGGPDQLRAGPAADPVAGPGQVRIAVYAAGVNPVDAYNRGDGRWAEYRGS